jgi:hypothetical protein
VGAGNRPGNDLVVLGSLVGANAPPTVAQAARADPTPVTAASTTLTVLGDDDAGESNLIYAWSISSKPPGAQDPVFSDNGNNHAKHSQVTFSQAGLYGFMVTITDSGGLSVTSAVEVPVAQTLSTVTVSPGDATVLTNETVSFTAIGFDQFGHELGAPLEASWSVESGGGLITQGGLYTAPATAGTAVVRAERDGISGTGQVTIVADIPAAPSNPAATAVSASEVNVTWTDNSLNETSFIIERATDAAFTQGFVSAQAPSDATSFMATGLAMNTTYYFRVRAANAAGESANSDTVQATTPGVPAAPAGLSAFSFSSGRIRLNWVDASNNEDGFHVEMSSNGGTTFSQITTVGPDLTQYTVSNLAGGTRYHFRLRAFNEYGPSPYSNVATARTGNK